MRTSRKPKLGVFKFASCDGCQLTLLDCEDELLAVADAVEIAYFPEATSFSAKGPYDVSLVEGSITTPHDAVRIQEVRRNSKILVTIGACATAGGIQALRNWRDVREMASIVYAHPAYVSTLDRSTPVAAHVLVDLELRGCPIDKRQLLETLATLLAGRRPVFPRHAVCVECKERGNPCVLVASAAPCLGPVTQAGCGALCPSFLRPCYGCFGPKEAPNTSGMSGIFSAQGVRDADIVRTFRGFNAFAEPFRRESEAREGKRS